MSNASPKDLPTHAGTTPTALVDPYTGGERQAMTTWYAAMTGPQMEETANTNLRRQGFWTFYPFQRVRRKRKMSGRDRYRVEWIDVPYFPRYLFVAPRKPAHSIYDVNETNGVATVVNYGAGPLPIPNDVMDELMQRADFEGNIGYIDLLARKRFIEGQQVRFKDNSPFAGLVAAVSIDKGKTVRVWLEALGREREISVPPDLLTAS